MAEWSIARICKIRARTGYVGSNPAPSTMDKEQTKKRLSVALLLAQAESYDFPILNIQTQKGPIFPKKSKIETPIEKQSNNTFASHNRNINQRHTSGRKRY